MDGSMNVDQAAFAALPGEKQTVPMAELTALIICVTVVDTGSFMHCVTDHKNLYPPAPCGPPGCEA